MPIRNCRQPTRQRELEISIACSRVQTIPTFASLLFPPHGSSVFRIISRRSPRGRFARRFVNARPFFRGRYYLGPPARFRRFALHWSARIPRGDHGRPNRRFEPGANRVNMRAASLPPVTPPCENPGRRDRRERTIGAIRIAVPSASERAYRRENAVNYPQGRETGGVTLCSGTGVDVDAEETIRIAGQVSPAILLYQARQSIAVGNLR